MRNSLIVLMIGASLSCGNIKETKHVEPPKNESKTEKESLFKKGFEVLPELKEADSLQILYYDDPYGDPKRYARFFTHVNSSDPLILNTLTENLNQTFRLKPEVTNCHSEGKVYLFKDLAPLKTVYFSTKKDSCSYLYFIKDGMFYEFTLDERTAGMLASQRRYATAPTPETTRLPE